MCDQQIRVCKVFFLETVGINEDTVYGTCQKKDSSGIVTHDGRGRHKKHKCVPNHMRSSIRENIDSSAPVELYYCRKHSQTRYLPESLTLRKMYRMYQQEQQQQGAPVATESAYRKIFKREFNYSFFVPQKKISATSVHSIKTQKRDQMSSKQPSRGIVRRRKLFVSVRMLRKKEPKRNLESLQPALI